MPGSWITAGARVLVPLSLLGLTASRAPVASGFVDVSMEWKFEDEGRIDDRGYCSTRLDLMPGGRVWATHRYERTVTRGSVERMTDGRVRTSSKSTTVYRSVRERPDSPELGPSESVVYEYESLPRVFRRPDGSVTLAMRRKANLVTVALHETIWIRDARWQLVSTQSKPVRMEDIPCDAVGKFENGLLARFGKLGPYPTSSGSETINGMFTPVIPADLRGSWQLSP